MKVVETEIACTLSGCGAFFKSRNAEHKGGHMTKRISFCALGAVAGILSLPVAATGPTTYAVDFTGAGTPQGWTVENGEYRSPEYSNAVDRIELRYSGADAAASATITAFPKQGDGTTVATLSAASSGASFDFPETTDFRSFRIAVANGLALSSFAAYVSADTLNAPFSVAISKNTTGTSFDANWYPVVGATGYRAYVWTNAVVGASAGTAVWQETFANAPAKTSTVVFKDEFTDNGTTGWTFEKAYASISNGAVRVGTTSDKGVLVSPPLPAFSETPLTLSITAWRQTTSDGVDMPVGVVSGGVTNIVGVVVLGDEAAPHHVTLPALNADDRIAIFSPTNKASARAIIDDVAILSGYSEGSLAPSYIVNGLDVGLVTGYSFTGLPSVPVLFAVEAYGRRGVTSEKTEAVEVDLSNPKKVPQLNACPVSSLTSPALTYTQNFDSTAAITVPTGDKDWLNGTTLPYWQAYKDADAVDSFNYNAGTGSTGGLYVFATNRNDPVRALGAYSTQNDEFSFGLAFTNDMERTMTLSSVAYSAQQWGFKNDTNQTMTVSVKVVDGLDWISAYSDGWTEIGSTQSTVYGSEDVHDTPVSTPVAVTPAEEISIAPGQVLMLKWTIHSLKSGKPGMMGIDDVTVTFASGTRGLVIRLAGSTRAP